MNPALLRKTLRETAILFLAIAVGVFGFAWFRVWVVSEIDSTRFKQILELIPQDWQQYTTVDFEWIISYLGRTSLTLDEPFLVMLLAMFALVRGSDFVSGEISRGTMEMLLSQPISRRQVFWVPVLLAIVGVLLLCLLIWLAMALAVQTTWVTESTYPILRIPIVGYEIPLTFLKPQEVRLPMAHRVDSWLFLPGVLNLFCLGYFLVGVAACFSAWDRYRWRTLGLVIGWYMVSAMLKILAMSSATFRWLGWFTFFSSYEPELAIQQFEADRSTIWQIVVYDQAGIWQDFGPLGYNLVLIGLGSIALAVASTVFRHRDIPAPV